MENPTLVVSDPPHAEVDLDAASYLLGLDVFVTRLKTKFVAPEILFAGNDRGAAGFASAVRGAGFNVVTIRGAGLLDPPWPDPVLSLSFDASHLRVVLGGESLDIGYDVEAVGFYCRPPKDFKFESRIELRQAVATGHGPTIAEAIKGMSIIDFYFPHAGDLRRISIVPDMIAADGEQIAWELGRRFGRMRLDARLLGIRPRERFKEGDEVEAGMRRGYSFGTQQLRHLLDSISAELGEAPHFEFASRLSYAMGPIGAGG